MTDDNNDKTKGFRKYGTPVPTRREGHNLPDDETEEVAVPRPREGSTSQVPTGD